MLNDNNAFARSLIGVFRPPVSRPHHSQTHRANVTPCTSAIENQLRKAACTARLSCSFSGR